MEEPGSELKLWQLRMVFVVCDSGVKAEYKADNLRLNAYKYFTIYFKLDFSKACQGK